MKFTESKGNPLVSRKFKLTIVNHVITLWIDMCWSLLLLIYIVSIGLVLTITNQFIFISLLVPLDLQMVNIWWHEHCSAGGFNILEQVSVQ